MVIQPDQFLRALADPTRLRILDLLMGSEELCVCELTSALEMVQPKVSRHLAILRKSGILLDRRAGLWIYYRVHPELPAWGLRALAAIHDGCQRKKPYSEDRKRLLELGPRTADACQV